MYKENMTFGEILNDSDFGNIVGNKITKLWNERKNRPEAKAGFKYRKDGIDSLDGANHFNREYFINNIINIWNKTSNIPMRERVVIQWVCDSAILEYIKQPVDVISK